jgi:hypothetical protein
MRRVHPPIGQMSSARSTSGMYEGMNDESGSAGDRELTAGGTKLGDGDCEYVRRAALLPRGAHAGHVVVIGSSALHV